MASFFNGPQTNCILNFIPTANSIWETKTSDISTKVDVWDVTIIVKSMIRALYPQPRDSVVKF